MAEKNTQLSDFIKKICQGAKVSEDLEDQSQVYVRTVYCDKFLGSQNSGPTYLYYRNLEVTLSDDKCDASSYCYNRLCIYNKGMHL